MDKYRIFTISLGEHRISQPSTALFEEQKNQRRRIRFKPLDPTNLRIDIYIGTNICSEKKKEQVLIKQVTIRSIIATCVFFFDQGLGRKIPGPSGSWQRWSSFCLEEKLTRVFRHEVTKCCHDFVNEHFMGPMRKLWSQSILTKWCVYTIYHTIWCIIYIYIGKQCHVYSLCCVRTCSCFVVLRRFPWLKYH